MGPEVILLVGVCMYFLQFALRDCISLHRRERMGGEPEVIFVPIMPPFVSSQPARVDIEMVAPLDESLPGPEETCSICFDEFVHVKYRRKTKCGHVFCSECLREWFHKKPSCPLCMTALNT